MKFPNTIRQAKRAGMSVRREVRYFAVDKDGILWGLYGDWHNEYAYNWRKAPKKKRSRK